MTHDTDIIVVGAGPAGLSAALEAARGGARVALVEKHSDIGHPVRTSGGSWVCEMQQLGVPQHLYTPMDEILIATPRARAHLHPRRVRACVLDVAGVYAWLGEQCAEAACRILTATDALGPMIENGRPAGVRLRQEGNEFDLRCTVVVDASGVARVVASALGRGGPWARWGDGLEYQVHAPDWPRHTAALLIGSEWAPCGCGWVFPHGDGQVGVGVGVTRPDCTQRVEEYVQRLLQADGDLMRPLTGARVLDRRAGRLPAGPLRLPMADEGLLVVGDAAGQASPMAGEGIAYAMRAGRLAGQVAAAAVAEGDVSARRLAEYQRRWLRLHGRKHATAARVNRRLCSLPDGQIDREVRLLAGLTGDQGARLLRMDCGAGWALGVLLRSPACFGALLAPYRLGADVLRPRR